MLSRARGRTCSPPTIQSLPFAPCSCTGTTNRTKSRADGAWSGSRKIMLRLPPCHFVNLASPPTKYLPSKSDKASLTAYSLSPSRCPRPSHANAKTQPLTSTATLQDCEPGAPRRPIWSPHDVCGEQPSVLPHPRHQSCPSVEAWGKETTGQRRRGPAPRCRLPRR